MGMKSWHIACCSTLVILIKLAAADTCDTVEDCTGFKSECMNNECKCPTNFTLHSNGHDCQQVSCSIQDCLLCDDNITLCYKCEYFLSDDRTSCLKDCPGGQSVFDHTHNTYLGPKCTLTKAPSVPVENGIDRDLVIGVVAGVGGALLLCIMVLVAYCVHIRRTRRNVNLNETHYADGNMQAGNVKKVPMYDNKGFDKNNEPSLVHNLIDRDVYLRELNRLQPHAHTLLTMLNDIRHKLRAMDKSDPRVPTYKGVIHQLCRVLVLIHKKDPGASIPSDALGLMEWAHQMIEDKQSDVEPEDDSLEPKSVNKISYIEVPPSTQTNPYATPVIRKPNPYASLNKRNSQLNVLDKTNTSFYSSVPVPVDYDYSESPNLNHVSVSQNNTLKTATKEKLKRQYEIPWDRKIGDSFSTLNCSGSDLTMGYFANGRFYDPTPRQQGVTQNPTPEIYAPASSYSDRSNPAVFSTFTGGIPRYYSSSSHTSTDTNTRDGFPDPSGPGYEEMDDLEDDHDGDGFPFNLNDATEPVEV